MKFLLATLFCLGSLSAFSHDHMEGKTFEEKKSMMLSHIDKKLQGLNESKTCVSSATDEKALKECRQKMKERRKEMKKDWKDKKKK